MIPFQSHRPTAVPKTWQARVEILKAIDTLAAQYQNDRLRRRAEIAAIRRDCDLVAQSLREVCREWAVLVRSHLHKFDPDQPRVPAGNSDGGQWTSEGGSGPSREGVPSNSQTQDDATEDRIELADAANDNLTPEETCQQAYSDAVALARINPSLSPTDYLKVRGESAVSLDDCLDLANGDLPISPNGDFVFFDGGGIVIFSPGSPPI